MRTCLLKVAPDAASKRVRNGLMLQVLWGLVLIAAWCAKECQSWSWIVATSTPPAADAANPISTSAPPPCPSYCLNALSGNVDVNVLVGLWWCQGTRFPNEQWIFDASSSTLSLLNAAETTSFCLDIADPATSANRTGSSLQPPSRALLLSNCTPSSPTQRWGFEPDTLRLKSLAGFNSSTSSYVYAYRPPGQLNYYLYLTENGTAAQSFTMIDSSVMAFNNSPALPPSNDSNLILNGNLELLTSFSPLGLPLDYTSFPNQQIVMGSEFVLCHWAVQGDLTLGNCSSARCSLPAKWCSGSNIDDSLVFLNWQQIPPPPRQGGIMQTVPTYPGSTYLLMFDMKNPFNQRQSVQLSVSPVAVSTSGTGIANQGFQVLSNQSIDGQTQQFRFTASGSFVNVSFTSEDSTQCGPLINNIQLYHWDGKLLKTDPLGRGRGNGSRLMAAVIVGWLMVAGFAGGALVFAANEWHRRRRRKLDAMLTANYSGDPALQSQITLYSYEQLRAYTQDFSTLIGEGGFGKVYFGRLPGSGLCIAVKRQNAAAEDSVSFRVEVELLSRVHHRYIVKFLGYCDEKGERMLVFEFMPNKSLYNRLHVEKEVAPLRWEERLRIAYQVAYALEYLHHGASPPVLHRDVKSANVLLSNTLAAKLADLGISKVGHVNEATHWTSTMTVVKGSRGYLDPYYLQTSMISQKSDVYSFGVLLLELITGRKAITPDLELLSAWVKQQYWDERKAAGGCTAESDLDVPHHNILDPCLRGSVRGSDVEKVMEIARCCLHEEPRHRPSMLEIARQLRGIQLPSPADNAGRLGADVDYDNYMGADVDNDNRIIGCSASTEYLVGGARRSNNSGGMHADDTMNLSRGR